MKKIVDCKNRRKKERKCPVSQLPRDCRHGGPGAARRPAFLYPFGTDFPIPAALGLPWQGRDLRAAGDGSRGAGWDMDGRDQWIVGNTVVYKSAL